MDTAELSSPAAATAAAKTPEPTDNAGSPVRRRWPAPAAVNLDRYGDPEVDRPSPASGAGVAAGGVGNAPALGPSWM